MRQLMRLEVEVKFRFSRGHRLWFERAAQQTLGARCFTDEYWDSRPTYALTTQDVWLRRRDQEWELKAPLECRAVDGTGGARVDAYEEFTGLEAVQKELQRFLRRDDCGGGRAPFLQYGLEPVLSIDTKRSSFLMMFRDTPLRIDLDDASGYFIGEAELVVSSESQVHAAKLLLQEFVKAFDLDTAPPLYGKVLQRLKDTSQDHYHALVKCGLVQRKTRSHQD